MQVFGGRDNSGNYLSEVWLLRAYAGSVSPSSTRWSGFGNGQLESGVNSTGQGVEMQYLTSCASQKASPSTATATSVGPASTGSDSSPPSTTSTVPFGPVYDTAITHKVLAPLSLALFLPAFILFRSYSPPFNNHERSPQHIAVVYFSGLLILVSYGLGLAGLAMSFTSLSLTPSFSSILSKRSSPANDFLQTGHGRAGLAFFLGLYGIVPLFCLLSTFSSRFSSTSRASAEAEKEDEGEQTTAASIDTAEKLRSRTARSASQSLHTMSRPSSPPPRHRTHSWGPSTLWRPSHERRVSSDSESVSSASPQRTFEVINRPNRVRRPSSGMLSVPGEPRGIPLRGLGDIDWLQRRRSVGAVVRACILLCQRCTYSCINRVSSTTL